MRNQGNQKRFVNQKRIRNRVYPFINRNEDYINKLSYKVNLNELKHKTGNKVV